MEWLNKVVVCFVLNCLFVLTTLLGLFVFGLIPSVWALVNTLKKQDVFEMPYGNIGSFYFKSLKNCFKENTKFYLITTLILNILLADFFVLLHNKLLFSMLLIPTVFLCLVLFLFIINFGFMEDKPLSLNKKIKLAFVAPLIKPSQFLYLGALIIFFTILYFIRSEIILFTGPCLIILFLKFLLKQYENNFDQLKL